MWLYFLKRILLGVLIVVVAVSLHARLYDSRPEPGRLTLFYLVMSAGGAMGGLFTALVAPLLFDWVWEHPLLVLAAAALLPRFPLYRERALALGESLSAVEGLRVLPDPPQVNMMHLLLDLGPEEAVAARDRVAEETGLWLFGSTRALQVPGRSRFELYVGERALEVEPEEVARAFELLLS